VKAAAGVLAAATIAALGAVVGTVWIGSAVKEEPVVGNPYEEGLRQDADRRARAALGWDVRVDGVPAEPGRAALRLRAVDREGRPLEGAALSVFAHRAETSRAAAGAGARPVGPGEFAAEVDLSAPGGWLLRVDVVRGEERVRVEKAITVGAATPTPTATPPPCSLAAGPCTLPLAGGAVTLELSPRPLRTMAELAVTARLRGPAASSPAAVEVAFEMAGMDMGPNVSRLAPGRDGRFGGKGVLVRCPSGRNDWVAEVRVARPGEPPARARFAFAVSE